LVDPTPVIKVLADARQVGHADVPKVHWSCRDAATGVKQECGRLLQNQDIAVQENQMVGVDVLFCKRGRNDLVGKRFVWKVGVEPVVAMLNAK
jgi:hypothetical protein